MNGSVFRNSSGSGLGTMGLFIGVVTNIEDPDGLGRVKVKIPRFSDEEESNWARVSTFMGGNDRGAVFLPEVDDEVLVMFEMGDMASPYVIGSLHNGTDVPPYDNGDGSNDIRVIKSRSGHILRFDDTDGSEMIEIIDKTENNSIVIDSANDKITITSNGDLEIKVENGEFKVEATDVSITASGNFELTADGDITAEASGNMDLSGSEINLN